MERVPSRELRNSTRRVLARVAEGEVLEITVDGRPVAVLRAPATRPRFLPAEQLVARLAGRQADPGLRQDLDELAPDTTDDLEW